MFTNNEFLREEIIKTGALVEESLELSYNSDGTIEEVLELENQINGQHIHIDEEIFKYIALQRPTAKDLRLAISAMRINTELERIGDQSLSIKRYSRHIHEEIPKLGNMQKIVSSMLKLSLDSFVYNKAKMAMNVIVRDKEVNEINRDIVEETLLKMKNHSVNLGEGLAIVRIAKNFERIGDLTTNISEAAIFLVSGEDIRHLPSYNGQTSTPSQRNNKDGLGEIGDLP